MAVSVRHFLSVLFVAASVTACGAIEYGEPMPKAVVDDSFEKVTGKLINSLGTPYEVTYYLKVFEHGGKIAFCGLALRAEASIMDDLWEVWLQNAFIAIGQSSNRLVSARFIPLTQASQTPRYAGCVQSPTPATPDLLSAPGGIVGEEVTVTF